METSVYVICSPTLIQFLVYCMCYCFITRYVLTLTDPNQPANEEEKIYDNHTAEQVYDNLQHTPKVIHNNIDLLDSESLRYCMST